MADKNLTPVLVDSATHRDNIRRKVVEAIAQAFPLKTKTYTVEAHNPHVDTREFSSREQKQAILDGKTLNERLRADIVVRSLDGKVTDEVKNFTLLHLPYFTPRHTFILDGTEYSVSNQIRTKPGVYTRRRGNEDLEAAFNLSKGANFRVSMDPEKGHLHMEYGTTKIPLYPVLRALGTPHQDIATHWGAEVADANRAAFKTPDRHVEKLYARVIHPVKQTHGSLEEKVRALRDYYDATAMDPVVNKATLGHGYDKASPTALLAASRKLLEVHRAASDVDDRDSLEFKTFHSVDDFLKERVGLEARSIRGKLGIKLDASGGKIERAIPSGIFTKSINSFLTNSSLSAVPTQTNPMELIDHAVRVTSLGEGAISSERAIPLEARNLHSTHLGIMDPVRTPESMKSGIDIRAALSTRRDDAGNLYATVYDVKANRQTHLTPSEMSRAVVAFPGEALGPGKMVDVLRNGAVMRVPSGEVTHQIEHASDLYAPTTNLLPLFNGMQGNRALMASKHQTQALSLIHREPPLVQVASWRPGKSVEQEMTRLIVPTSPVDGIITKIDGDYIHITPDHRKVAAAEDEEDLYNDFLALGHYSDAVKTAEPGTLRLHYDTNFPLAAKSFLHNTIKVKEGDRVTAGQPLADSNFTKDDTLALGTNLSVAYMPYRGLNTNDGIVVSQGAADKLCFDYNTEILTTRGWLKRPQLTVTDRVACLKDGVLIYDAINDIIDNTSSVMVESQSRQFDICVTPDHCLYVSHAKKQNFTRVPAVQIMAGRQNLKLKRTARNLNQDKDFFELPPVLKRGNAKRPDRMTPPLRIPMDDWCTIFGLYIAEGHCEYIGAREISPRVSIKQCKKRVMSVLLEISTRLGFGSTNSDRWLWGCKQAVEYLRPFGKALVKYLPEWTWHLSTRQARILLHALQLGDGHFGGQKLGSYYTSSPQLRDDVQRLALHCGYSANWSVAHHAGYQSTMKDGRKITATADGFRVAILGEEHAPHLNTSKSPPLTLKHHDRPINVWCVTTAHGVVYVRRNGKPRWCGNCSEHMYKHVLPLDADVRLGKERHRSYFGNRYTAAQYDVLDDDGVVKPGTKVHPKDPLIAAVRESRTTGNDALLGKLSKSLVKPYQDEVEAWDHDRPGTVIDVSKTPGRVTVTVKTEETLQIGDKLTGRFGNKGVIAKIIPDHQMIQSEQGKPIDVLFTSAGIISRINPAQVVEAALGKVADHTGQPISVEQYATHDNVAHAQKLLSQHGLKDKETVLDPITGRQIPNVFVGKSYILKLFKTTDSNWASHSAERYDFNQQPAKGGDEGAKAIGKMEFDGLVAHNARNVLREAATIKSQKNDEFWRAIQLGLPTPSPQPSFAYNKFLGLLQGAGVKVSKQGSRLSLGPLTDKDIKSMSAGALKDGNKMIRAKDLKPEDGGLFDPAVTGGTSGTKWSHVDLHEPIVNPVFEEPVRRLLGLTQATFADKHAEHGGTWFRQELGKINTDKKIDELRAATRTAKGPKLDDTIKQLKYLTALKAQNLQPANAYVLSMVPVTPPILRPVLPLKDGRIQVGDANLLYRDAFLANQQLSEGKGVLPADAMRSARTHLYDAVSAVFGVGEPVSPSAEKRGAKGYIAMIAGTRPGNGFFQGRIMKRQQDVAGRATIAPDPTLSMDEIGVPEDMLHGMYAKFIIGRLVKRGYSALAAQKMVEDRHPLAREELINESHERPVFVNRAPSLHRFSLIGAYPKIVTGKTLMMNPFSEKGLSSDYDGDAVQIHAPVTPSGIADVKKMTLSNLIFSDRAPGRLNVEPDMEAILGLHRATETTNDAKPTSYTSRKNALEAYHQGKISLQDAVKIAP